VKRYLVDANLLISFVTDRHSEQQARAARLFEQAAQGKALLLCPHNVLIEFAYVMDKVYRQPKALVRQILADLVAMPGVEVPPEADFAEILALWPEPFGDLGDALIAALARREKKAAVATFDRAFVQALKQLKVAVWEE
jgi:predicted nucleic acid-binding protein